MKSVLFIMLFFVGAAAAAPTKIDERVKYTTSLNSMAAVIMSWYGSLISTKEQVRLQPIDSEWNDYRSQYPKNIDQLQIVSTDLTKLDTLNEYQFIVNSMMKYNDVETQLVQETFIFQVIPFSQAIIKNIDRNKTADTKKLFNSNFNRSHYKVREFVYSWLAYLDGVEVVKPQIYAGQWLEQATYDIKIGDKEIVGTVSSTLLKRKKYLATGGHLLRSLDLNEIEDKANHFVLDLIIEWEGVNQDGKPVFAKISQEITYQVQDDCSWKVLSIKEQHLLPDIAPWTGLLC